MPDDSAALLAWLRKHVKTCRGCDAAWGWYCTYAWPTAEKFATLRADEVEARRVARLAGMGR